MSSTYPLDWYKHLYQWVAKYRIEKDDINLNQIHIHLVTMLCTCVFIWAFVVLGHLTISAPMATYVGYSCAFIATSMPFMYRFTNKAILLANLGLAAGLVQICTHAYYTGGIEGVSLIWLGIIPFAAGIILGPKAAFIWTVICFGTALIFFFAELMGHTCPVKITRGGYRWSRNLTIFGWTFLTSTMFFIFIIYRNNLQQVLEAQKEKIDDLFRVLFHDLANPLGRVDIGLQIARKQENSEKTNRGIEIANQGVRAMMDITQSVRKMYAISQGKQTVELEFNDLEESVKYVCHMFQSELDRKQLEIIYLSDLSQLRVMVELSSFNHQVLANIISNSIKFSRPQGKIEVSATDAGAGFVRISVRDEGIGMHPNLVSDLFNVNKKTSRDGTSGERGTGYGMHIMQSFVHLFGGRVEVTSRESEGTTFHLFLRGEWK